MDQGETWPAGRPRPWAHCVGWGPSSPSSNRGRAPQFLAHTCCGQMAGWINMSLGTKVDLDPSDIVLDWDPAPLPKKGAESPIFGPYLLWPNSSMDQDATWCGGRPRPWPPRSPSHKGAQPPISAHICCNQMVGWIKMQLGREVGLDPSNIVLDGDPAPPCERGTAASSFQPMSIVATVAHLSYC